MNSRLNLLLRGSVFRVTQTVVSIVIGLLMMPFLISSLGEELYGLWVVVASIVGTYYLLDMGFNQAITRYVVKYIHQDNPSGANRIINTALVIYSILGLVLLLISIVASLFGVERLMEDSTNIDLTQTILVISGLAIALEFPSKAFPGIISAYMRFDVIASVRFTKTVIDAVLIYLAVSNGYGLVAMASITFVTGLASTIIYVKYSTHLFKELKFDFREVDKKTLKDVFHFSKWVFVFDVSSTIRDKMDVWFISFFLGLSALPVYYVAVRLVDYAISFLQQATNLSGPVFTEHYAKNEKEALRNSFLLFFKINITFGVIALTCFYVIGGQFIVIWMGDSIDSGLSYLCLVVLSLGRFVVYFTTPVQSMLMTINKHKYGAYIAFAETLVSLALCVVLIPRYGVVGAAYSVAIPYMLGRVVVLPFILRKYIELPYVSLFVRISLFLVVECVGVYLIREYFVVGKENSIILLLLASLLLGVLGIIFSLVLWDKRELRMLSELITKYLRKYSFQK